MNFKINSLQKIHMHAHQNFTFAYNKCHYDKMAIANVPTNKSQAQHIIINLCWKESMDFN
jgi:hypothetical protein